MSKSQSKPKFSIILPVYSELSPVQSGASGMTHFRGKTVQRAIKSVMNQQCKDWELIIIEDGCVDDVTPRVLDAFADMDPRITVYHKANENRAIAYNYGMDRAQGEWICWLDSDDEYMTTYLRTLDKAIKEFPEYDVFNFGCLYHYADFNSTVRGPFTPAIEAEGHEWFRSGGIVNGCFVFRRDTWASNPEKYRIPDEVNPFQFAAKSKFPMKFDAEKDEFFWKNCPDPETCFQDGEYRQGVSLGNPWGQDFLQFYNLTRDHHSKSLDSILYIVYPRTSEDDYTDFGEVFETGV